MQLKPEAAQSLGLALHELATNAAKYGALSRVRGRVHVAWKRLPPEQGGAIELRWTESKGPKVSAPKRRGFGSMVIEHNLVRSLEAKVDLAFDPDGPEMPDGCPGVPNIGGAAGLRNAEGTCALLGEQFECPRTTIRGVPMGQNFAQFSTGSAAVIATLFAVHGLADRSGAG